MWGRYIDLRMEDLISRTLEHLGVHDLLVEDDELPSAGARPHAARDHTVPAAHCWNRERKSGAGAGTPAQWNAARTTRRWRPCTRSAGSSSGVA